jgi:hypothetical protein
VCQHPAELSQFALPKHADTCRVLHAAFPSQQDANILFEAGRAIFFLQAICVPYHEIFVEGSFQTSETLAAIPSVTAHPVILARKLIHLALCVQQLDPSFDRQVLRGNGDLDDLRSAMHRYYDLASTNVTCHDELLDSLEGLECLICESVYLINLGRLRRALACLRRACTLAQFMGLHRKSSRGPPPKQLDPATRISAEFTWCHIAYVERYISLLLGIPTSITGSRFGSDDKLTRQTDSEWFEKVQIDICDYIIARNQGGDYDFGVTEKIDGALKKMASSMPRSWWTPLDMPSGPPPDDIMLRVATAQMQIIHYNMLTVLHLPYVLRANTHDLLFDHSRETCLYASREVLSRFVSFRSIVRVAYCCRLVDFCAFTAAMTLLLAYLNGRSVFSVRSTHQRLSDRALIEKTLEALDELNRLNDDELSRETATLTRRLMDLEAQSINSHLSVVAEGDQDNQDNQDKQGHQASPTGISEGQSLYLTVPYFGCVKVTCNFLEFSVAGDTGNSSDFPTDFSDSSLSQASLSCSLTSVPPAQILQSQLFAPDDGHVPLSIYHFGSSQQNDQLEMVDMPDLFANTDDWVFQGVDTAFFDSIIGAANINIFN